MVCRVKFCLFCKYENRSNFFRLLINSLERSIVIVKI